MKRLGVKTTSTSRRISRLQHNSELVYCHSIAEVKANSMKLSMGSGAVIHCDACVNFGAIIVIIVSVVIV